MAEIPVSSYDEIPYQSNPFSYTHPDTLAATAILAGLEPAPVDRCRVLELGCAGGGNLIPMAEGLPGGQFVGVDLSSRQVGEGKAIIESLGLSNVQLHAMSITDVGEDLGQFDYIVCHGVYSWVPPEVQRKILEICNENLSPNGVAYVSYNAFPGWHLRAMVREMMLYHVQGFSDPRERVRQAIALVERLIAASGSAETTYSKLLQEEMEILKGGGEHYVFHEHLESVNEPLYFHQFIQRAADAGLQYLDEAQPYASIARIDPSLKQWLAPISNDVIRREQYLDFMSSRKFRWTLLCHQGIDLRRTPDLSAMERLSLVGYIKPAAPDPDLRSTEPVKFVTPKKMELTTNDPVVKCAFAVLGAHKPQAIAFDALCREVQSRARDTAEPMPGSDRRQLAGAMLQCYQSGVVELHAHPPTFLATITDHPKATLLARLQAADGVRVTNRRHRMVEFSDVERMLVTLMDGTRDRAALKRDVTSAAQRGDLQIQAKDGTTPDASALAQIIDQSFAHALDRISQSAVLVG